MVIYKKFGRMMVWSLLALSLALLPQSYAAAVEKVPTISYTINGLKEPAEILIDRWGVPHIYASSKEDVFFVQGFNAARDRLWQIDLWRKRGLGKLSETFGPAFVEQDRAARLFLYRGDMYREWLAYGSDTKQIVTAFTAGINEFIKLTQKHPELLPVEFKELGYKPEFWSPEDVVRIRSHGLVRNVQSEVVRAQIVRQFGLEVDALRSFLEPEWKTKVPEGLDLSLISPDVLKVYNLATQDVTFTKEKLSTDDKTNLLAMIDQLREQANVGSNNWAISPKMTETGRPILANDPHRTQSVPSLRYIAHLVAPGINVIGAGEPALPGISIGHNEEVAFGLTIFAIDQEDLYVYETNPDNPNEYKYKGRWEPMEIKTEYIPVKGQKDVKTELKFTRHGPVIYEDPEKHVAFAVRAAWLEPGMSPYLGSIDYMRAKNWDEFVSAMNRWGAPSENQVYADIHGNIGWKPGGLTPIRPNWDGLLPVPGDGRYEWAGFRDMDQLPVEFNPERGWVATANEMNLPKGYPYKEFKLGFEWSAPYRYQRIAEVLSQSDNFSLNDMLKLQTDHVSIPARRIIAQLKGLKHPDPKVMRGLEMLTGWDGNETVDSGAAALFEVWYRQYLGKALTSKLVSPEALQQINSADSRIILDVIENPEKWLGKNGKSVRNEAILTSLREAMDRMEQLLGPDSDKWAWGKLHQAKMEHPLANVVDESLRKKLNVGPFPRGGGGDTVGNTSYRLSDFTQTSGASFRMVLDVGNWDNSLAMNTPGQSGNPDSPHYRDLFPLWAEDKAFPLLYSRDRIEKATEQRIELIPAKKITSLLIKDWPNS